jgi:hypothetical protein
MRDGGRRRGADERRATAQGTGSGRAPSMAGQASGARDRRIGVYGVGRGRIDLLVRWPYPGEGGQRAVQREALELKVWKDGARDPLPKGLAQLDEYLHRLGLATGVLVIFDRRACAPSTEERTRFEEATTPSGRAVTVLRA